MAEKHPSALSTLGDRGGPSLSRFVAGLSSPEYRPQPSGNPSKDPVLRSQRFPTVSSVHQCPNARILTVFSPLACSHCFRDVQFLKETSLLAAIFGWVSRVTGPTRIETSTSRSSALPPRPVHAVQTSRAHPNEGHQAAGVCRKRPGLCLRFSPCGWIVFIRGCLGSVSSFALS